MMVLDRQIENNTISNAYIFEGLDEDYNLEYAKEFANKVFKKNGIYLDDNLNPDLKILNNKDSIIDITSIREIIKDMVLRPSNNKIKFYIIHNAHNLRQEGSNALLKSIEELKAYTIIIFTTTNSLSLLQTIRSRCQLIRLNSVEPIIDEQRVNISELISNIYAGNLDYYFKHKEILSVFSEDKVGLIDKLSLIFNDLLNLKYRDVKIDDEKYLYNLEAMKDIKFTSLEKIISMIDNVSNSFKNNVNFDLSLEHICYFIYREGGSN